MQITEEEARQRWCPVVRVDGSNRVHNTLQDGFVNADLSYRCIASECMAWREHHIELSHGHVDHTKRGYCGLAGQPTNMG
jgi:hypothetical protein